MRASRLFQGIGLAMPTIALDRLVYAVIVLMAVVVGGWIWRRTSQRAELAPDQRWAIAFGAFAGAMLGAKLPFVMLQSVSAAGLSAPWLWSDGKTILSGLLGGYLGVEIAKSIVGVKQRLGDGFAVPVAISIAIGRLACFAAGCCFGRPTDLPWGVVFPLSGDSRPRHPAQLYETLFHLLCAGCLLVALRRGWCRGHLLKVYLLTYLVYRFGSEFLRAEPSWWWGLTVYQWACLPLALLLIAHAWWQERRWHLTAADHTLTP
jgi:phosphatidylglycerol:prolipoprotein diacylglycerol transferase